ncbi:DUF927 domain-containing protein [Blautia producta]|uniref:DUF927 domain-containing protein n=4 Tax=Blautia producta TaxID=33035 RepID=A0A7G5MY71_9FIRM|nr:DUF927 domain-containing protein [Blautia producta ATCC 27340 = DSM 2950]QMW79340.1 DUF927 domain-containing protein [Blautia producta]QIB55055.1 DUF927 domain-containing protein [Blautia producta ATCC 27340 = DSM 2950]QIB57657.1 DUF927 domain-containing protein [Blautia producta ATCC 27340 = DSM 2950]QMW79564.1 DUF927 domain-containing protein [Blautia producta]
MEALTAGEPFPDEIFYKIFEIEGNVERAQYIEALKNKARQMKRANEFNSILKAFFMDYSQKMKETGNSTNFTGQALELQCGPWRATDLGVSMQKFDNHGQPVFVNACTHPILPIEIYKNVDTGRERVKLAYFKYGQWQNVTVNRKVCADNSAIVDVLSDIGIEVTSENAKPLVKYISDCIGLNPAKLEPRKSINRLGWAGSEFMPYADDIVYDGDEAFDVIYKNVKENGDFSVWKEHCSILRKNKIVRMAFAASFASCLIELVNALPFVLHIWSGESGTCKTVAIMAAMSIWGNPKMGGLVKTMNTTKVNIMRTSAFLYSLPYAGDELQTMKDKWTTNFDQLIYQITEGIDRGRGRATGGVEETKTWRCSYLFTGEEPITKANSRAGSKNRVIEIEVEEKLLEDGNRTVGILTENYGYAGKILVEYLQGVEKKELQEEYKRYFDVMCKLDTTEKQAMAMACILLADRILTEVVFTGERPLTVDDVKMYLRSANEVDVAERSYQSILNWIAKNPVRFQNPNEEDSANKGEVWGRIDDDEEHPETPPVAVINKDVLCEFLEKNGFDYAAVSKKWAAKERVIRNSQGKYIHNTKVFGIKANYVKLNMEPDVDSDGFMAIEDEQMELPFD